MNKQELIGTVAETTGMTKNDASKAVEAVFDSITAQLKNGDEVRLVGFGTFSVSKRKASTGRNPRTGEPMKINASAQPKFKPGREEAEASRARGLHFVLGWTSSVPSPIGSAPSRGLASR